MSEEKILKPDDYVEPRCVLCDEPYGAEPQIKSVPQQRIIAKMDEYMSRRATQARSGTFCTGWRRRAWAMTCGGNCWSGAS